MGVELSIIYIKLKDFWIAHGKKKKRDKWAKQWQRMCVCGCGCVCGCVCGCGGWIIELPLYCQFFCSKLILFELCDSPPSSIVIIYIIIIMFFITSPNYLL